MLGIRTLSFLILREINMITQSSNIETPEMLSKMILGCSLVAIMLLLPFTISHFFYERFILGFADFSIIVACSINVWYGIHGRYSLLVNTYFVLPLSAATFFYAMFNLGTAASYPPFILILAYYLLLPVRRALFFNVLTMLIFIPLAWFVLDQAAVFRFSAAIFGVSLFVYIAMREINNLHAQLKEAAVTDELTGVFNRSLLVSSIEQSIAQKQRTQMPMALVTIDVDNFKSINDTLGHPVGDRVLSELGALLLRRSRKTDKVFRVGGEEFLVIIYNAEEQMAVKFAEDLRKEVEQAGLLTDRQVTVSAGVSSLKDGMDAKTWVSASDEKLYRAKENGRNQVVL